MACLLFFGTSRVLRSNLRSTYGDFLTEHSIIKINMNIEKPNQQPFHHEQELEDKRNELSSLKESCEGMAQEIELLEKGPEVDEDSLGALRADLIDLGSDIIRLEKEIEATEEEPSP